MSAAIIKRREKAALHRRARRGLLHTASDQDGDSAAADPHQALNQPPFILKDDVRPPQIAYPPAQAAIVSGRTRTRIFGAIKSGELIARKDGKATIILHDELVRWVRSLPVVVRAVVLLPILMTATSTWPLHLVRNSTVSAIDSRLLGMKVGIAENAELIRWVKRDAVSVKG
jgi:hypothetical protein